MSTPNPIVSVVCAWYNRAEYIEDTLNSLLNQNFEDFEIILINDGSPDPRVRDILSGFSDSRLTIIHQENTGFTRAIKNAIEVSRGEFIAIHGSGDISKPNRLKSQFEAFQNDSGIGIVGCYYVKTSLDQSTPPQQVTPESLPSNRDTGNYQPKLRLSHGELMYRRSVYDAAGGYREFFNVGQGTDLWLRMLDHASLYIVPDVLYEQRIFPDGVSVNLPKVFHRLLLSGAMRDSRNSISKGLPSVNWSSDRNGNHLPLYLTSRAILSLRYLFVLMTCYALEHSDAEAFRRVAIANSRLPHSLAARLLKYLPFRTRLCQLLLSRSTSYRQLVSDIHRSSP